MIQSLIRFNCYSAKIVFAIFLILFPFGRYRFNPAQSSKVNLNHNLTSVNQDPKSQIKTKIQPKKNPKILQQEQRASQQQTPALTLKSDGDHIQIYEEVKFSLEPAQQVINSPYNITFIIDDKIKIEKAKNVNHVGYRFNSTGKHNIAVSGTSTSPQLMILSVLGGWLVAKLLGM